MNTSCGYPAANSTFGGWIQVMDDSILLLNRVLAAGYELRLLLSCGWLEFQRLDTSCDWLYLNTSYNWLHPMTESSSSGWMQLEADSILRLTMSCGWLEFHCLDTNYSWLHATANSSSSGSIRVTDDSILRLNTSCSWFYPVADLSLPAGLDLWLTYTLICQVNLRTYSANYIIFMVCFLPPDFQLPLIHVLAAASRTLKKPEEAWRSFKTLAVADYSFISWFELRQLIRDLRSIDYLQNVDPDAT